MNKLKLTGQNLDWVFNSRLGHACICRAIACRTKRPNLKLKNKPKQLLGYLPSAFELHGVACYLLADHCHQNLCCLADNNLHSELQDWWKWQILHLTIPLLPNVSLSNTFSDIFLNKKVISTNFAFLILANVFFGWVCHAALQVTFLGRRVGRYWQV